MKQALSITITILLLVAAGFFATTVVIEQTGQSCGENDRISEGTNSWQDVYFIWEWYPQRDEGMSFIDCIGPSQFVHYHPIDVALVVLGGATLAGYITAKNLKKAPRK